MTSHASVQSGSQPKSTQRHDDIDDGTRMTFGDHLEELRRSIIKALLGVVVAAAVCLIFGKEILSAICAPLWRVQLANGLPPQLQVLSPTAAFTAYLKIALLAGLIVAMPWVFQQIWNFISSGLYAHERRFAKLFFIPGSLLFALGVAFVYFVVLPVVLQFFISFNKSFEATDLTPGALQRLLLTNPVEPEEAVAAPSLIQLPVVAQDPKDAKPGDAWINESTRTLMIRTRTGLLSTPLHVGSMPSPVQSQFAIDFYISFVLMLCLGFGVAFETPIAVFFLARTGIVPIGMMQRARRYVILGCIMFGAVLTPPDVISQMLLAGPMYGLFEIGLFVARVAERRAAVHAAGP